MPHCWKSHVVAHIVGKLVIFNPFLHYLQHMASALSSLYILWNYLNFRVSNSLDPDEAQHFVGPDLGPNCFQKLSADDTKR